MKPTITLDEANRRLDDYIDKAVAQLPAGASLKERLRIEEESCDDTGGGDEGMKHASRNYEVTGIEAGKIPSYFDTLRDWWQAHDFRVLDNEPKYEFLWVENNTDSFRMTLKANDQGHLFLISASPCVWPNGTPE